MHISPNGLQRPRDDILNLAHCVGCASSPDLHVFTAGCCEPIPGDGWAFVVFGEGLEIAHDFGRA